MQRNTLDILINRILNVLPTTKYIAEFQSKPLPIILIRPNIAKDSDPFNEHTKRLKQEMCYLCQNRLQSRAEYHKLTCTNPRNNSNDKESDMLCTTSHVKKVFGIAWNFNRLP